MGTTTRAKATRATKAKQPGARSRDWGEAQRQELAAAKKRAAELRRQATAAEAIVERLLEAERRAAERQLKTFTQREPRQSHTGVEGNKHLLTIEETARTLGIGRTLAQRLVARGDLPSLQVGSRCRRVPLESLKAFIAARVSA